MDLDVTKRQKEGVWILDLRGVLVMGDPEGTLRQAIITMTIAGAVRIILNFAGVSEIDPSGLGALVFCYARVVRLNGALKLLNLNSSHLNLMFAAKLTSVFELFSDEQDAVNSFFPDRPVQMYDILKWIESRDRHATPGSRQQTQAPRLDKQPEKGSRNGSPRCFTM
jgi:anti-sigma B factor antagonist